LLSAAAVAVLLLTPCAGLAAEPPARITVQAPASLRPGEAGKLVLSLAGTRGEPTPALQPIALELRGAGALGPATVTVPAGASRLEVAIRAPKPGLWQIEVRSPGLTSGFAIVACVALERRAVQRLPSIPIVRTDVTKAVPPPQPGPEKGPALEPKPRFVPNASMASIQDISKIVREATAAMEAAPAHPQPPVAPPPPPQPPQGYVKLFPQPTKVQRGAQGWISRVEVYWFEGDEPRPVPADLDLSLLVDDPAGEARVAPAALRIPSGQIKSQDPATISGGRADTARVQALYAGGKSEAVEVDFLATQAARLGFAGPSSLSFRGLTSVATDLYVRLFDDSGQQVVSAAGSKVTLTVQGPTGTLSYVGSVPAGETQVKVPIALARPGEYSIVASTPGLADSPALPVRFALDWLLLASALLGGVLGSLTRVLYRRERLWPKGLPRSLALGVAAALLVLLLSLFGVLSVLGDALPAAEALQKVPATNLAGALLLGLLAGLVFDKIFARFLGARPSRKGKTPKPPASAPSPPPAPAMPRP
jgi:hypothetical protein